MQVAKIQSQAGIHKICTSKRYILNLIMILLYRKLCHVCIEKQVLYRAGRPKKRAWCILSVHAIKEQQVKKASELTRKWDKLFLVRITSASIFFFFLRILYLSQSFQN